MPVVSGTFTATGRSAAFTRDYNQRGFNFTLSGTFVATVQLERSFDQGVTWHPVTAFGTDVEFTIPVSETWEDPESTLYALNCENYTSGTVTYRLSQ